MKIGLLASGGLGFKLLKHLSVKHQIEFVFTDAGSDAIVDFANRSSYPVFIGNPRKGRCTAFVADKEIDVLVSINYLFLIESDLIQLPSKLAFNIHGSLLPRYRGRTPHVWAIINNERETGITAHVIDENCDTGRILAQEKIPILPNDTGYTILNKFAEVYPKLVDKVFDLVSMNDFEGIAQDEIQATYFGKRTPEDGEIDWDWYRERIQNWIRAQAPPYPGAFSYYQGERIIFRSSKASSVGYHYEQKNGTILHTNPLTIKTSNGALEVEIICPDMEISFETGELFKSSTDLK
ncbi:methionyl-tRNA formyltransferase [Robiginitalea sp. M366]|uniref:methionyl-tRNA formyltransferase n=1 Tax=Robiginitalea aestuariiviva TaxID=3036903 RepID=UPI00240E11CF|nr:methionyl-tRNA formyltransferase [Robiginitalea aestuariiviva]MDG1571477.1 methionyl-tRNA formyltransferase [Robiginitalea aestuariiviva]